ncbi:M48 family metallopeptidase [Streptomyces microflavus]|uniref:M48 family metallopeptidase n=1 Tax=Streptomyces microflavus TaxID=1919 RepID=UPI00324C0585
MSSAVELTVRPCPECGTEVRADRRFVAWCTDCGWNVDPEEPEEPVGRLVARRRRLAREHGERLLAEVSSGASLLPRRDAAGVLAYTLALAVHTVTAVLLVAGVLLVVLGWGSALPALGLLLLVLAWVLRPRLDRLPTDTPVLLRRDAPELFALIDEVVTAVGTTPVHAVAVTADFNAAVTTYELRQRRLLILGLALWEPASPQVRLALLGHELGHYANGDTRQGIVLSNALRSLANWYYLLTGEEDPTFLERFANLAYAGPRLLVGMVLRLLDRLTLRTTQRGEYLADAFAARVGSTEAALALMDRLLIGRGAESFLRREANTPLVRKAGTGSRDDRWQGLWERLAAQLESVPDTEYERLRRVSVLRAHSVDSTHPPTHLRRVCLGVGAPLDAVVQPPALREAAITGELAAAKERIARAIVKGE